MNIVSFDHNSIIIIIVFVLLLRTSNHQYGEKMNKKEKKNVNSLEFLAQHSSIPRISVNIVDVDDVDDDDTS